MATNGVSYESKLEYRPDEYGRIYLRETTEYSDGETSVEDRQLSDDEAALVARSANLHYKLLDALRAARQAIAWHALPRAGSAQEILQQIDAVVAEAEKSS